MNIEEVLNLIILDLKLNGQNKKEFTDLFTQLVIFNILLAIPEQHKEGVKEIINNISDDQNVIVDKLSKLGINKDQAKQIIDNSIQKSISEVVREYSDVLTSETKEKLQNYI